MNLKLEKAIRHSYYAKWVSTRVLKILCWFKPSFDANRLYKRYFGRKMDLKNPESLPEKIVWMECYADTSLWTKCEDKYLMRSYVEERGYGEYLPKLYGVWKKAKDIDFSSLPETFVLKTNHGCGDVLLCKDKRMLNEKLVKRNFRRMLNIPYGYNNASLHYTRIKPCIIAEELLGNDFLNLSKSIVDFKVWCINGKAQSIMIIYDRLGDKHSLDLFDVKWDRLEKYFNRKNSNLVFDVKSKFSTKPVCLEKMLEIAENLAKPFPQVRVDFYIVNSKPIVGEMTFAAGYTSLTEEYYKLLAQDIKLERK